MIKFENFLERVGFGLSEEEKEERRKEGDDARPPLYLAQHALLTHFPRLRRDVLLPDYVYSEPPESEVQGGYRRPPTEDGLLINVWVGGEGRSSPSHTVCSIFLADLHPHKADSTFFNSPGPLL